MQHGANEVSWTSTCRGATRFGLEYSVRAPDLGRSDPGEPSMVVVMGVTGAGKSYFINQLAGKAVVREGLDLDSCKLL